MTTVAAATTTGVTVPTFTKEFVMGAYGRLANREFAMTPDEIAQREIERKASETRKARKLLAKRDEDEALRMKAAREAAERAVADAEKKRAAEDAEVKRVTEEAESKKRAEEMKRKAEFDEAEQKRQQQLIEDEERIRLAQQQLMLEMKRDEEQRAQRDREQKERDKRDAEDAVLIAQHEERFRQSFQIREEKMLADLAVSQKQYSESEIQRKAMEGALGELTAKFDQTLQLIELQQKKIQQATETEASKDAHTCSSASSSSSSSSTSSSSSAPSATSPSAASPSAADDPLSMDPQAVKNRQIQVLKEHNALVQKNAMIQAYILLNIGSRGVETINRIVGKPLQIDGFHQRLNIALKRGDFSLALKKLAQEKWAGELLANPAGALASTFVNELLTTHLENIMKLEQGGVCGYAGVTAGDAEAKAAPTVAGAAPASTGPPATTRDAQGESAKSKDGHVCGCRCPDCMAIARKMVQDDLEHAHLVGCACERCKKIYRQVCGLEPGETKVEERASVELLQTILQMQRDRELVQQEKEELQRKVLQAEQEKTKMLERLLLAAEQKSKDDLAMALAAQTRTSPPVLSPPIQPSSSSFAQTSYNSGAFGGGFTQPSCTPFSFGAGPSLFSGASPLSAVPCAENNWGDNPSVPSLLQSSFSQPPPQSSGAVVQPTSTHPASSMQPNAAVASAAVASAGVVSPTVVKTSATQQEVVATTLVRSPLPPRVGSPLTPTVIPENSGVECSSASRFLPARQDLEDEPNLFRSSRRLRPHDVENAVPTSHSSYQHNPHRSRTPSTPSRHHFEAQGFHMEHQTASSHNITPAVVKPVSAYAPARPDQKHDDVSAYAACDAIRAEARTTEAQVKDPLTGYTRPMFQLTPKTRGVIDEDVMGQINKYTNMAAPFLSMVPDVMQMMATPGA